MTWLMAANAKRHAVALLRAVTLVAVLFAGLAALGGCRAHMEPAPVDVRLFGWKLSSPQPTSPPALSSPATIPGPASSPASPSPAPSSLVSPSSDYEAPPLK